ncbi:3-beta hydroxysteroid dehydrogenase/isomerase family-domain-containing protein [Auriculariales sp. MPI-PUGE-AT-0066]|nr:3-beta hydroxysteroid dehydrogenase/isomerase family-domain-containing protein [Auriculariales sp. MPI-PUGE-AT-0066]
MSTVPQQSYLVVGGCGFLGWTIVQTLLARKEPAVAVFDIAQRHEDKRVQFFTGDMCDQATVEKAIKQSGATVVLHTASPLAVGGKMSTAQMERVNVEGTKSVVAACLATNVPSLVFTSSASVVWNGDDLIDVDERAPYASKHVDIYTVTKMKAEKIVLEANGHGKLRTCALRPSAIFGPGDRQLIPGLVQVLKEGKQRAQVGDNLNLWDATYVENLADAHVLAADKLSDLSDYEVDIRSRMTTVRATLTDPPMPTSVGLRQAEQDDIPTGRSKFDQFSPSLLEMAEEDIKDGVPGAIHPLTVAGQAFFITNGEPVPFWCVAAMVWQEYGGESGLYDAYKKPWVLPRDVMLNVAGAVETVCGLFGIEPTFTRFKLAVVSCHRWYNIEKARRVLGYEPKIGLEEGIKRSVAWIKQQEALKAQ